MSHFILPFCTQQIYDIRTDHRTVKRCYFVFFFDLGTLLRTCVGTAIVNQVRRLSFLDVVLLESVVFVLMFRAQDGISLLDFVARQVWFAHGLVDGHCLLKLYFILAIVLSVYVKCALKSEL